MCILLSYYSKIYEITADFVCLPPGEACRCIWLILPEPDSLGGFFLLKGNFFLPTFAKCLLLVRLMDQTEHKEEYIRIFLALLSSNNSCSLQVDEQSKAARGLSACCHHSTIISPKGKKGGKGLSEETEPLRPKGKPEKAHLSKVFPLEGRQLKKIKK